MLAVLQDRGFILYESLLTCRMSRKRKYVLATSWNCSNKLTGRKVMMLYLDVMMQLLWMKRRGKQRLKVFAELSQRFRSPESWTHLPHTETFRCTACHWLWLFFPPLQRYIKWLKKGDITTNIYREHLNCCVKVHIVIPEELLIISCWTEMYVCVLSIHQWSVVSVAVWRQSLCLTYTETSQLIINKFQQLFSCYCYLWVTGCQILTTQSQMHVCKVPPLVLGLFLSFCLCWCKVVKDFPPSITGPIS